MAANQYRGRVFRPPIHELARRAGALATVEAEERPDSEVATGRGGL